MLCPRWVPVGFEGNHAVSPLGSCPRWVPPVGFRWLLPKTCPQNLADVRFAGGRVLPIDPPVVNEQYWSQTARHGMIPG